MTRKILLIAVSLLACSAGASVAEEAGYFQQYVHYTIEARLDTKNKMLEGHERILYVNNSPDSLTRMYLHLYPNAFKSKHTKLMRDYSRPFNLVLMDIPEEHRSFLELENVLIDGRPVTPEIDDTIAEMSLPRTLPPGDTLVVEMDFREKIRKFLGRAGYEGEHYDMAQWYPKVVVYDENGFHPDKFGKGEFYGEFGTFDVFLEVPEEYVVAATGTVQSGDPGWEKRGDGSADEKTGRGGDRYKTIHFRAEKVHDFAWSADPDFIVQDTTWNGIEIRSFYTPRNAEEWKDSTLVHGVRALQWLSDFAGPYPYPQLSIVDGLVSGGMEYPMLVMDGKASEGLVLHEVGHIFFYGILANDERAEAWLDEGFTAFQTGLYLTERYGAYGKKDEWNFYQRITPQPTLLEKARKRLFDFTRFGYGERIAKRSDEFVHSYHVHVYTKTVLMLRALKYMVGEETFRRIMREYYDRWKFKHVDEARFREVCEEISGMDLDLFFDQWLHSRKTCDYELDDVDVKRKSDGYEARIKVKRKGEIVMPLELTFRLEDGTTLSRRIEGRLRTITARFDLPSKPVETALNPGNEIIDMNLSDNFIPRRRRIRFDWPGNAYRAEDAYEIRYRPGFWYNDVDGFKAGLHLSGGYQDWLKPFELGVYYGFESRRLDFSAAYGKRVRFFGSNGTITLSGYKMEGRQDATLQLTLRRRKYLSHPPSHDLTMGLGYHELRSAQYIRNGETYEKEPDIAAFFGYRVDPQLDVMSTLADIRLRLGRKWFGGEYEYEKLSASFHMRTRKEFFPITARMRFFLGSAGGVVPYQQKFYIASGGPLAEERFFLTRSPGAVPEDLNYHTPGHGNLRGYLEGDFGVNRLVSMNVETDLPLPLIGRLTSRLLGKPVLTGFFDAGRVLDDENPIGTSTRIQALFDEGVMGSALLDAGLGLRSSRRFPFYDLYLRLDFPFYVNKPEINGEKEKLDFRYVFSLRATF